MRHISTNFTDATEQRHQLSDTVIVRRHLAKRPAPADNTTWARVPGRGRGLIARADIDSGKEIHRAPAVPAGDTVDEAVRPYVFMTDRGAGCTDNSGTLAPAALVFGPMALCNHDATPNAQVCFANHRERGMEARLVAIRPIHRGEEITISYSDTDWYHDNGRF